MPSTVDRLSCIQRSIPIIACGIWLEYSFVETIEISPPFFFATFTSPGVQVTMPFTQTFFVSPVFLPLSTTARFSQ